MFQVINAMAPGPSLKMSGGGVVLPFGVTYVSAAQLLTDVTAYAFTALNLGAPVSGPNVRWTVLCIGAPSAASQTVSSVIIGGLSATQVKTAGAVAACADIWIANTTTLASTADVTVTFSGANTGCGVGSYRMINPTTSTASATATAAHVAGVVTLTQTIPTGGFAVAVVQCLDTVAAVITWTGTTNETKNYEADDDTGDDISGAISSAAGSNLTFIATSNRAAPTAQNGSSAAWGP